MNRILIFIILVTLLILLVFAFLAWKGYQISSRNELSLSVYKKEYQIGENPKIEIKNDATKTVCLSSCYPYYLESDNGSLKSYHYGFCPYPDINETCIKSGESKFFELVLHKMDLKKGIHRIAVPACIGCVLQQTFRKDKFFYSDEFLIR
ncbi:hypothetical protein IH779_02460 [Patescibacteria group bacterium]|nr:hypothetical protein [Patescibacteria group bacterium]